ncbi:hypothetical protein SB781_36885, partial [Paraburkholderia sp. SIMBA_061]
IEPFIVFITMFKFLVIAAVVPILLLLAFKFFSFYREILSSGGYDTKSIETKPPDKITKNSKGYYVLLESGERVFVSYAELYPNDP